MVLSVYTDSMTTIYLSMCAQVAISTFFMKSPVANSIKGFLYETLCIITFMKHEEKKHFIYSTEHLFHCLFIEPI